jgi:hypothetical protein
MQPAIMPWVLGGLVAGSILLAVLLLSVSWRWGGRVAPKRGPAPPPRPLSPAVRVGAPRQQTGVQSTRGWAAAAAAVTTATAQKHGEGERAREQEEAEEVTRLRELVAEFEASLGGGQAVRWEVLLAVGDLYRRGAYPRFLPDEELAAECFRVAAACPAGRVAGEGQSKFVEARLERISAADRAGAPLPPLPGRRVCALARDAISRTPRGEFEKPAAAAAAAVRRASLLSARGRDEGAYDAEDEEDWLYQQLQLLQAASPARRPADPSAAVPRREDPQNVHDHGVSAATRANLAALQAAVGQAADGGEAAAAAAEARDLAEVRAVVARLPAGELRQDAERVLDALTAATHGTFGVSERAALALVWRAIARRSGSEARKGALVETLARQLASAVEHGHVVCSTGKIARIVGALDGTGVMGAAAEAARPMWAVRDEIATLAARVRDEFSNGTAAAARQEFARRARELYAGQLGISPALLDPIVAEYAEHGFDDDDDV